MMRTKFRLAERDGDGCHYCGRKVSLKKLTLDHKLPKSRGGLDEFDNYLLSCGGCNGMKGDMSYDEFTQKIKDVGGMPKNFMWRRGVPIFNNLNA